MKDVYGNTSCNIAALGEPGDGCFVKRNPLRFFPCYIGGDKSSSTSSIYAFRYYNPHVDSREDDNGGPPLLRRGWVVQEKLLSTRVIYMGIPQLHWECARHTLSEGAPLMKSPSPIDPSPIEPFYNQRVCAKSDFQVLHGLRFDISSDDKKLHEPQLMIHLCKCWMRMVSDYSKMKFPKKDDRFIAFAGVAEAIAAGRGWTYVAGTWKQFWPFDLLWARYEPDPTPLDRRWHEDRFKSVIPSWSWAFNSTDSIFKANPAVYFLPLRYEHLSDSTTLRLTTTYLTKVVDFSCPDLKTQHSLVGAKYGDIKLSMRGQVVRGRLNTLIRTSGVQIHWDVNSPPRNELLFLLLMRWTEFDDEQQARLVLMKQMASMPKVRERMYFRVGVWDDYSPQLRRGRRLFFPASVPEEVVHLC